MNASEVIQKYNPYEIAKTNRIVVILEPLGNIHGYYNKAHGQRFIHINDRLPIEERPCVVSHLLYPALKNQDELYLMKNDAQLAQSCTEKM